MMKALFRNLGIAIVTLIFGFIIFVFIMYLSDYKPPESETIFETDTPDIINDTVLLKFLDWNIGYCGLDASMDFFYEGGKNVRPASKQKVIDNLNGVIKQLRSYKKTDFYFLQEVDVNSKRSFKVNEFDTMAKLFPEFITKMGINYKVAFVPVPVLQPMGKTLSGIVTMSRYKPESIIRYSFIGNYAFPKSLFMLDRCFLVNTYNVSNGKKLLVINTHNSAFDDGSLRKRQMEQLRKFITDAYNLGNYVIVGGDWNQCPPDIQQHIPGWIFDTTDFIRIEKDFLPISWTWVYKNDIPTNRRVDIPYQKDISKTTIIDFFLVSPNVQPVYVENENFEFTNSDHNPVRVGFRLVGAKNTIY